MSIKKPVGVNGPVHLSPGGAEFLQLKYPETKEGIELLIARSFVGSRLPDGIRITDLEQLDQDDFDFKIQTSSGSLHLELMEIAPLENLSGSYSAAPDHYKPYDFADFIYGKAMGKSVKYSGPKPPRIVLLLYVTDWAFVLSESVICLLQYWLQAEAHSFERVYVHQPIEPNFGVTHLLFPTPSSHWKTFDPDSLRENVVRNFSPVKWELK